jgi:proline racemase
VGIALAPSNAAALARAGELIKTAARQELPVSHPQNRSIDEITLAMVHGPSDTPGVSGRNAVALTSGTLDLSATAMCGGVLDRSPCGTGTSARMAVLHAKGELAIGDKFVHESLLGTTFACQLVRETTVGEYQAVVPTIAGRAWVTALSTYVLDSTDPFPEGFRPGDIWPAGSDA